MGTAGRARCVPCQHRPPRMQVCERDPRGSLIGSSAVWRFCKRRWVAACWPCSPCPPFVVLPCLLASLKYIRTGCSALLQSRPTNVAQRLAARLPCGAFGGCVALQLKTTKQQLSNERERCQLDVGELTETVETLRAQMEKYKTDAKRVISCAMRRHSCQAFWSILQPCVRSAPSHLFV